MSFKLLIIGAGASVECDFPLGNSLPGILSQPLQSICPSLKANADELAALEEDRYAFTQACQDMTLGSIDAFLERRREFRDVGRLSLAAALIEKQIAVIRHRKTNSTWHSVLYRKLVGKDKPWRHISDLRNQRHVAIITFNYDLNIEIAIARHLNTDTSLGAAGSWEHATECPIVHVHGLLNLDHVVGPMLQRPADAPSITLGLVREVAQTLAFTGDPETSVDSEMLETARRWVRHASEILFLGFGFDTNNLNRIGIGPKHSHWVQGQRELYATYMNMSDEHIMGAARHCCGPLDCFEWRCAAAGVVTAFLDGKCSSDFQLRRILGTDTSSSQQSPVAASCMN